MKSLVFILLLILIFPSIVSALQDPYIVYGYVKYPDNSPGTQRSVVVHTPSQTKNAVSDNNGRYSVVFDNYNESDPIIVIVSGAESNGTIDSSRPASMINITVPFIDPGGSGGPGESGGVSYGGDGGNSGGSGNGGGGGATSGEAFENIICTETDREYVNKGSTIIYRYELECNIAEYINFIALSSSGDIAAKVEILKSTSSLVEEAPPGIVFRNLNVWVGNYGWATEKNIRDPVIGFKVDRVWVSLNNIDESSITMYRFYQGQWVPLNTTKKSEDAGHIFLEAHTPGFSSFAISGSSYFESSADNHITGTETDNDYETSAIKDTTGSAKWNNQIMGIVVALFALFYGIILLLSKKIRTMVLFCRDDLKDPGTVDDMNTLIKGPILYEGQFREVSLTKEANILRGQKPEGYDRIRFNRLLLESAYPQEIKTRLHERFGLMNWLMLLVIFIPLVYFIGLVGSPIIWLIGILLEWIIVMYLVLKVKKYSSTSSFT
ncbi:MAG: PGF-pre-PGF domain-containing protein [ANME-2 cluster archaeon]|nr:PGF-pre-PGF domain-containing protein [ANME-2 cluster archaeon]